MTRIDPSKVPDEFLALSVRPVQGSWASVLDGKPCCCLLGERAATATSFEAAKNISYYTDQGGEVYTEYMDVLSDMAGLDREYGRGLNDGWECGNKRDYPDSTQEYIDGRKDGAAAYQACVDRGLIKPDEEEEGESE